jgi:DNA-binding response OmpR family regulator
MLRIIKHIILVGDQLTDLLSLQRMLFQSYPGVACVVAQLCDLQQYIGSKPPDIILVYVTGDVMDFPYVQAIRQQQAADELPVFVCRGPLAARELELLLNEQGWGLLAL